MRTSLQATFMSDVARLRTASVLPRVMSAGARANAVASICVVSRMSVVSSTRGAQELSRTV